MWGNLPLFCVICASTRGGRVCGRDEGAFRSPPRPLRVHTSPCLNFIGSFYFECLFTAQSCRSVQPGNRPLLFPSINMSGGGSPEGAEVQTRTLFSPLWALFGYFLARQKVTTSPPQRRREQRKKSRKQKRENQQRGAQNLFLSPPIATAPSVCYNNHAQSAKEGVFNAEQ